MERLRSWLLFRAECRLVFALAAVVMLSIGLQSAQSAYVTFSLALNPYVANNGCVGCTLNGAGTWDLYAQVYPGDNFGLASYQVTLLNTTSIFHRSPRTNLEPDPNPDELEPSPAGFQQLRSPNNVTPIVAGQDTVTPTPYIVRGFGQTANSFQTLFPGTFQSGIKNQNTAAGWGASLLIAEGTYSLGNIPWFGNVVTATTFNDNSGLAVSFANVLTWIGEIGPGLKVNDFNHVTSIPNEVVTTTMTASIDPQALDWSGLLTPTYTPMFGAPAGAAGVATPPTWDPDTQQFIWNTKGATRGRYTWDVFASHFEAGADTGRITIDVTQVPEPSSLVLFSSAR